MRKGWRAHERLLPQQNLDCVPSYLCRPRIWRQTLQTLSLSKSERTKLRMPTRKAVTKRSTRKVVVCETSDEGAIGAQAPSKGWTDNGQNRTHSDSNDRLAWRFLSNCPEDQYLTLVRSFP